MSLRFHALTLLLALTALASPAAAQDAATIRQLIEQLRSPKTSAAALEALVKAGEPAVPHLIGEALEGTAIASRGWAIVALGEIGGAQADARLREMHSDPELPALVRTWAAAARARNAKTTAELVELARLIPQLPALGRPVGKRLVALMAQGQGSDAEQLIAISLQVPQLQQALAGPVLGLGADALAKAMTTAQDNNVRRQAAGYLGALGNQDYKAAAKAVIAVYQFDGQARAHPWKGGALWVPGLRWQKADARALAGELIAWHVWCQENGQQGQQQQIHNNLRSVALVRAGKYPNPGWQPIPTTRYLKLWGQAVGKGELRELLDRVGVTQKAPYAAILAGAPEAGR